MLQVLSQIILSILCVYGGYRLLHDLVNLLERRQKIRRERNSEMQKTTPNEVNEVNEVNNDLKGGENSEPDGK